MLWLVIPTHNEAAIIAQNLARLLAACRTAFAREEWRIVVADNASSDATRTIVARVAAHEPRLALRTLDRRGKGGAVMQAWRYALQMDGRTEEPIIGSSVYAFLDADLATDLQHLPELIAAVRGGADIAAASRYLAGSRTQRSLLRHCFSRCNRVLLRLRFGLRMSDPPCGAKAVSARVVRDIVPHVRDDQWFFDTELCIRASRAAMRIVEIPVVWAEPRKDRALGKMLRITAANFHAVRRVG